MWSRLVGPLSLCVLMSFVSVLYFSRELLSRDKETRVGAVHAVTHQLAANTRNSNLSTCEKQGEKAVVPRTQDEAVVFGNLYKCLYAVNLTNHFQENGLMDSALQSAGDFVRNLHHFLPHKQTSYRSHCWSLRAEIAVSRSTDTFSGSINNSYSFKVDNVSSMHSFTLNSLEHVLQKKHRGGYKFSFTRVCLPHIFVPGFAKCGTTFLYNIIRRNPSIIPGFAKEPRWWIRSASLSHDNFTAYFAMYFTNYIPLLVYNNNPEIRWGRAVDASPSLLYEWPMFPGQPREVNYCLLPSVIPQLLPDSKFIVMMRNPVHALYSWFWFSCTREGSDVTLDPHMQLEGPRVFHERVLEVISIFNSCSKRFPVAKCVMDLRFMTSPESYSNYNDFPHCGWLMLHPMIYYVHIQKWLATVPRDHFLFLTLEELSSNEKKAAYQVWQFLGVTRFYKNLRKSYTNEQRTVNYHTDGRLQMRNDTVMLLEEFFQPHNLMLAELLGRNEFLNLWKPSR